MCYTETTTMSCVIFCARFVPRSSKKAAAYVAAKRRQPAHTAAQMEMRPGRAKRRVTVVGSYTSRTGGTASGRWRRELPAVGSPVRAAAALLGADDLDDLGHRERPRVERKLAHVEALHAGACGELRRQRGEAGVLVQEDLSEKRPPPRVNLAEIISQPRSRTVSSSDGHGVAVGSASSAFWCT